PLAARAARRPARQPPLLRPPVRRPLLGGPSARPRRGGGPVGADLPRRRPDDRPPARPLSRRAGRAGAALARCDPRLEAAPARLGPAGPSRDDRRPRGPPRAPPR